MRESPYVEHKLDFAAYLATPAGRNIEATVAHEAGVTVGGLRRMLGELPSLDLYMPVKTHRQVWFGTSNIVVGTAYRRTGEATLTLYDINGNGHQVTRSGRGPDNEPVLILNPAEPKIRRRIPRGMTLVGSALYQVDEGEVGDPSGECDPITLERAQSSFRADAKALLNEDPPEGDQLIECDDEQWFYTEGLYYYIGTSVGGVQTHGVYMTLINPQDDDGWMDGDVEVQFDFRFYTGSDTAFSCYRNNVLTQCGVRHDTSFTLALDAWDDYLTWTLVLPTPMSIGSSATAISYQMSACNPASPPKFRLKLQEEDPLFNDDWGTHYFGNGALGYFGQPKDLQFDGDRKMWLRVACK